MSNVYNITSRQRPRSFYVSATPAELKRYLETINKFRIEDKWQSQQVWGIPESSINLDLTKFFENY